MREGPKHKLNVIEHLLCSRHTHPASTYLLPFQQPASERGCIIPILLGEKKTPGSYKSLAPDDLVDERGRVRIGVENAWAQLRAFP